MTATVSSVIIPMRNAAGTLDEQLDSLASQESTVAWEIILVDNGSTDETHEIARKHEDNFERIRVRDRKSRGSVGDR